MIAKKNPGMIKWSGKATEIAEMYGLTFEQFQRASLDFLECEGYIDSHECEDLHEYLTYEPRSVQEI